MSFLTEAAYSPENLKDGDFIKIVREKGDTIRIGLILDGFHYGNVLISKPRNFNLPDGYEMKHTTDGPCAGGFIVRNSLAADGWGPLLYDVAMEVATIEGTGLIPDRNHISREAYSIWDYYEKRRADVDHKQLDDPNNTLTPIKIDNCKQDSSLDYSNSFDATPLSKIYSKEPDTLIKLVKMGKLKVEGEFSFYSRDNLGEAMEDWEKNLKSKYGKNIMSEDFDIDRAAKMGVNAMVKSLVRDLEERGAGERLIDMFTLSAPVRMKKDLAEFLKKWINTKAELEKIDDPADPNKPDPYSLNLTDKRPKPGESDWPRAKFLKKEGYYKKFMNEMVSLLENDPCWDNYEMVGMKKKNGRSVPNCVPRTDEADDVDSPGKTIDSGMKQSLDSIIQQKKDDFSGEEYELQPGELSEFVRKLDEKMSVEGLFEAEYQGRKVTLNKPFRDKSVKKKFSVYVKDGDKVKKVSFGDPNMKIKKNDPERRKSFRARHNCDNPGPKTKARYWSCKKW